MGRGALLVAAWLSVCVFAPPAYGGVGVVLNESLHESMDRITGTGHTAVYFSNICAESPVKLRLCGPGELGSVMSTYIHIGEDQPFGWNIVPLSIYLYGVEDAANRPLFGSYQVKRLLEERYRENYLEGYCGSAACQRSEKAEWREMVAATMIRGVYIFAVDSSVEQDREFIAKFNAAANKNDFNGITRNCADFTKHAINSYFPNAVRRDLLNDFGMTSPKAVARTFTRYALKHPEANFRVLHFAQVPGTIPRSSEVRAGTEQLYRSKKWLIPMTVFAYHELPFAAGSYLLFGRFNPERAFEKYATPEPDGEILLALAGTSANVYGQEERQKFVGTGRDWKEYRKGFDALMAANRNEFDGQDLGRFFKELDRVGIPSLGEDGAVWMEVWENGESLKVGLSASNVLARGSNAHLAYKFLATRAERELKSPKHGRETMQEFKGDWDKLQRVSEQVGTPGIQSAAEEKSARGEAYGFVE